MDGRQLRTARMSELKRGSATGGGHCGVNLNELRRASLRILGFEYEVSALGKDKHILASSPQMSMVSTQPDLQRKLDIGGDINYSLNHTTLHDIFTVLPPRDLLKKI